MFSDSRLLKGDNEIKYPNLSPNQEIMKFQAVSSTSFKVKSFVTN